MSTAPQDVRLKQELQAISERISEVEAELEEFKYLVLKYCLVLYSKCLFLEL